MINLKFYNIAHKNNFENYAVFLRKDICTVTHGISFAKNKMLFTCVYHKIYNSLYMYIRQTHILYPQKKLELSLAEITHENINELLRPTQFLSA